MRRRKLSRPMPCRHPPDVWDLDFREFIICLVITLLTCKLGGTLIAIVVNLGDGCVAGSVLSWVIRIYE